jgi:hypothetical protein
VALLAVAGLFWVIFVPVLGIPFNQVEASVSPVADIDQRILTVSGTTTFPDGARLGYLISHERAEPEARPDLEREGIVTVSNGRFAVQEGLVGWPEGYVAYSIFFELDDQSSSVRDYAGHSGERLVGPQVITDSGDKWLEAKGQVVIPPLP